MFSFWNWQCRTLTFSSPLILTSPLSLTLCNTSRFTWHILKLLTLSHSLHVCLTQVVVNVCKNIRRTCISRCWAVAVQVLCGRGWVLELYMVVQILLICSWSVAVFSFDLLHPKISMHILHTVLYTFPEVLTRRISLKIQSFSSFWSFP